jgi:hypothetical protein
MVCVNFLVRLCLQGLAKKAPENLVIAQIGTLERDICIAARDPGGVK